MSKQAVDTALAANAGSDSFVRLEACRGTVSKGDTAAVQRFPDADTTVTDVRQGSDCQETLSQSVPLKGLPLSLHTPAASVQSDTILMS